MTNDRIYLNVVVAGLNASYIEIEASIKDNVDDLKKLISRRLYLIEPDCTLLYKLWDDVSVLPVEDLLDRIPHPDSLRQHTIAVRMKTRRGIREYFEQQPAKKYIHIIVVVPHDEKIQYWLRLLCGRYWGRRDLRDSIFHRRSMHVPFYESADSETSLGTLAVEHTVLKLGEDFKGFICEGPEVLITQEYTDLFQAIQKDHLDESRGMSITGRPGTGKGTFLYYVLVERVLEAKTTVFQNVASHYFVLKGAEPHDVTWAIPEANVELRETWALVDSDAVGGVPHYNLTQEFWRTPFLLQVSAPKAGMWAATKKFISCEAMRSWTWNEFYILHRIFNPSVDVTSIRTIYVKFGGSLHVSRSLLSSSHPDAVAHFEQKIEHALDTRLVDIFNLLKVDKTSTQMDMDFTIFTIEPLDLNPGRFRELRIVSKFMESMISASLSRKEDSNSQAVIEYMRGFIDPKFRPSLHESLNRIWKQVCLTAFTRPTQDTYVLRAATSDQDEVDVNVAVPSKLITYQHDKVADTLLDNSPALFGSDLKHRILLRPIGQPQPTYDLLEVSSSGVRLFQMTMDIRYSVDRESIDDIWDAIRDASERADADVKSRFEALFPAGEIGSPFKVIFAVPKHRFEDNAFRARLGEAQEDFCRLLDHKIRYSIKCYGLKPIIGEA